MFGSYYRIKGMIACGIAGVVLMMVGEHELDLSTHYAATQARIDSVTRTCGEGRDGPFHYVDCSEALPGANRRTVIALRYISPADQREHEATVRCDTSVEETPDLAAGQVFELLAHRSDPGLVKRRKCLTLDPAKKNRD